MSSSVARTARPTEGRPARTVSVVVTNLRSTFSHVVGLLVLVAVWELWTRLEPSMFVPPISEIAGTFVDTWLSADAGKLFLSDQFWNDGLASLARASGGWFIACVIGITAGIVIGMSPTAQGIFSPLIRFGMATPSTALLPVGVVLFGITNEANIAIIAWGCTWPILVNTLDGVAGIDVTVKRTARSMRLSRLRTFWSVLLPGANPQIFAGMRVSLGLSIILVVVSELFVATNGVGYFLLHSSRTFEFKSMWAAVMLLATLGIIFNVLFALLERRVLRWHRQSSDRFNSA